MEIVIILLILAGACYWFGIRKTIAWNADARQQMLAQMLIAGALGDASMAYQIIDLTTREGWSSKESRARIVHALSIVKVASTPDVYGAAKEFGKHLHDSV